MRSHPLVLQGESAAECNVTPPVTENLFLAIRSPPSGEAFFAPRRRDARAPSVARDVEAKTRVDDALNFLFKAKGKDGAQKRRELLNMRPGDRRRCLQCWQVQRLQDKEASVGVRQKTRPENKADEKLLQENGRTSCRPRAGKPNVHRKLARRSTWRWRTPAPSGAEHRRRCGFGSLLLIAIP